jgi:hypothetical protein
MWSRPVNFIEWLIIGFIINCIYYVIDEQQSDMLLLSAYSLATYWVAVEPAALVCTVYLVYTRRQFIISVCFHARIHRTMHRPTRTFSARAAAHAACPRAKAHL